MKAVIIAIGDELTCGNVVDTNSAYLADQLAQRGIETIAHMTVGDCSGDVARAIRAAADRAELVLVTGGLGPTADDVTRQGLAEAIGVDLRLDRRCLAEIEEFFRGRGRKMVSANRSQAMIPAGAQALANRQGTAPGIAAKVAGGDVFVMPGVPHEMRDMFDKAVAARLPQAPGVILQHVVHTFGKGESDVSGLVGDLMVRTGPLTVGTTVSAGLVSIRITARAADGGQARRMIDQTVAQLRERLGGVVVGEGDQTHASVVGEMLRRAGQTLATAESCTGGLVGQMITAAPGAGDYYLGGVVAYANEVKVNQLGVSGEAVEAEGAVSEPVARAMADGCRERFGSDWAVALTGIAGPDGGTADKPVGLVYIALCGPAGSQVHRHVFGGNRPVVRRRAALAALNHLRLALIEGEP